MSLQMTVEHKDLSIPDAYVQVRYIRGTKDSMDVEVSFKAAADSLQLFEEHYTIPLDLNGPNQFKQAYNFLKIPVDPEGDNPSRRDFSAAVDI